MCTICGTTLQLSTSPQAERQRNFINELIAEGKDKEEIKAALVAEYGSEVLSVPSTDGFDLAAWIVPIAGLLAALVTIALAVRRWRRSRPEDRPPVRGPGTGIEPSDERRLEADLGRYDALGGSSRRVDRLRAAGRSGCGLATASAPRTASGSPRVTLRRNRNRVGRE